MNTFELTCIYLKACMMQNKKLICLQSPKWGILRKQVPKFVEICLFKSFDQPYILT